MQQQTQMEAPCTPSSVWSRQNYYFGKMLTPRDLTSEQKYLNEKRWLINRYGIGWGVLCGLEVTPHSQEPCKVIVNPGVALDQYGNEIIVSEPYVLDLKTACEKDDETNKGNKYYIVLWYRECLDEPSPIPVEDCGESKTECFYNRTRETYKMEVVRTLPEKCESPTEESRETLKCETDCFQLLDNPAAVTSAACPPCKKGQLIVLACVCYTAGKPVSREDIDNTNCRKSVFSNDVLYDLIRCLTQETWQAHGAHYDRRRYVPLLANTIKGLKYRDGKISRLEYDPLQPAQPFRITTDGDHIWITDQEKTTLTRIDPSTNTVIEKPQLDLSDTSWGIAFDGHYMWITHSNKGNGKLTRINVRNTTDCWSFYSLPKCEDMTDCHKYTQNDHTRATVSLWDYPQEVVYHDKLLYVSHGVATQAGGYDANISNTRTGQSSSISTSPLRLSIIDTEKCCLLKTIVIDSSDYNIPSTPILAMAYDGDALWILYQGEERREGGRLVKRKPVVRRIKYTRPQAGHEAQCEIGPPKEIDNADTPDRLAFDGTHLWVTHDNGACKIDPETGDVVDDTETKRRLTGLAYGGGDYMWSIDLGEREVHLNRIGIYSADLEGGIELKRDNRFEITDLQFDGSYLYVSAYYTDNTGKKKGIIHRILP